MHWMRDPSFWTPDKWEAQCSSSSLSSSQHWNTKPALSSLQCFPWNFSNLSIPWAEFKSSILFLQLHSLCSLSLSLPLSSIQLMDQAQYSLFLFTVETLGCLISLPLRFSSPSSFLAPSPTTFSVLWVSAHHGFSIVLWGFFLGVVVPQKI